LGLCPGTLKAHDERNYAGMSFYPENLSGTLIAREMEFCHVDVPDPAIELIERVGMSQVRIIFNLPIINISTDGFTLTAGGVDLTLTSVVAGTGDDDLIFGVSETVETFNDITVNYDHMSGDLRTVASATCRRYVETFTAIAPGEPPESSENLSAAITATVDFLPVIKSNTYHPEHISAEITAEIDFLEITKSEAYHTASLSAAITASISFWHIDDAPL